MHSAALLDQLAVLAAAPGGLDRLKQTVLTLAMQGKLVEQDPADEPACVLLERIRTEKQSLIDAGQLKKDKPLPPIGADEMPYALPAGWEWVRLGDVVDAVEYGTSEKADEVNVGIPVLRMNNIKDGEINYQNLKYVYENIADLPKLYLNYGDILFNRTNSYELVGKAAVFKEKQKYTFASYLIRLVPSLIGVVPDYLNLYLMSNVCRKTQLEPVIVQQNGQANVNGTKVKNFAVPFPSLAEQHRIVAKIADLFALCESLVKQQGRQERRRDALGRSLRHHLAAAPDADSFAHSCDMLLQHFDLAHADVADVADLRQTILTLAMQGKLVEQDPADEPAGELLKRIRAEKQRLIAAGQLKKDKPLPPLGAEEMPYPLPKGWEWVRLGEVGHDFGQKKPDGLFTYIDVGSINQMRGTIESPTILTADEAPSRARKIVKQGTVIYSTVRPYLLNIAIVEREYEEEMIASTAFAIVHPFAGIENKFLFYYLRSQAFIDYVSAMMVGMAYPAINDEKFFKGCFPVPPLPEQHRIVAKIEQLFALCDALEAALRRQDKRQQRLLASVCHHLTEPVAPA